MCSYAYNDFKQSSMNSNAQFPHTGNWLSSSYYSNPHSYYHPSPMQQHQMLSMMQDAQNNPDPNLIPWSHNYHQHQNFEWIPPFAANNQCQISEFSTEDSDVSPSPISNRTTSPSYNIQRKSPYEWMKKTSFQSEPSPGKTRTKDKYRVVYTDQQRVELEKEFLYNKYITIRRKTEMAAGLGLSERQVKIWFQNRRAKERKQAKKKQELQVRKEINSHSLF